MTGRVRGVAWRILGMLEVFLLGTGTDTPNVSQTPWVDFQQQVAAAN